MRKPYKTIKDDKLALFLNAFQLRQGQAQKVVAKYSSIAAGSTTAERTSV